MITFPLTPAINQVYISGDRKYIFDGKSWSGVGIAVAYGDKTYNHFQAIASAVWVIPHGLGKYPSVIVIDSSGSECEGTIFYDSINQITITFSAAFGGNAHLN